MINKRNRVCDFVKRKQVNTENIFINNTNIIEYNISQIYYNLYSNDTESVSSLSTEETSAKYAYKSKIDSMMTNQENEKEAKNQEIRELTNKLQSIVQLIEYKNETLTNFEEKRGQNTKHIEELTFKNENIIREIEEKLETYEQLEKLDRAEINEQDLEKEVNVLETKYEEMASGWEEYSSQMKGRIEELKNNINTKKQEYNFKYEKIASLKKEIDDISTKIIVKQELANFLNDEYQKIPVDINRNKFITKISDLTQNIVQEKKNIVNYLNELKIAESNIESMNDSIKRVDDELEDRLFKAFNLLILGC